MSHTRKVGGKRTSSHLKEEKKMITDATRVATKKKGIISPRMVLAFIDKNHYYLPSISEYGDYLVEDDVYRCRLVLWNSKSKQKTYKELLTTRKIPDISETTLLSLLKNATEKKYKNRSSPPFSSSKLCGATLFGNDGTLYTSVKNKSGLCTWIHA
jgi:hypothetical protein